MKPRRDILLVDDHPIIVVAVKSLIQSRMPELDLHTAATRAGASRLIASINPALAIIDLLLPDGDGLDVLAEILRYHPECKVLVFSMQDELRYGPRALRAGAKGYLMKGDKVSALVEAVREIDEGKTYASDALREVLVEKWSEQDKAAAKSDTLSDRELQVFRMLGAGKRSREIAAELLISPKTVESHRENMKNKLGCANTAELMLKARDWLNHGAPEFGQDSPR